MWERSEVRGLLELLDGGGHLDVLSFLQPLLTFHQVVDAVHHRLHQLHLKDPSNPPSVSAPLPVAELTDVAAAAHLRLSQPIQVGDVKGSAHCCCVHAPCPSLLETQVGQDLTETGVLVGIRVEVNL